MNRALFLIAATLVGCKNSAPKNAAHTLDFEAFTIETPVNWQKVNLRGIDSYVGEISIDSTNHLAFDYGRYSSHLSQFDSVRIGGKLFYTDEFDTAQKLTFYDSADAGSDIVRENIDGYGAKLIFPRVVGRGITGIYFDSIGRELGTNLRFNLYGHNLTGVNQKAALRAFRTIRFRKNNSAR
jgi:hypothetical protein